ncbi:MAG: peptidoglycan DD-metalloendopeptidase family protein [Chitinispirillaceae bacterium]|nr:peptidoglycan DD-metalloendopeptidase family protein [Chitinispirillaceae bacterium]
MSCNNDDHQLSREDTSRVPAADTIRQTVRDCPEITTHVVQRGQTFAGILNNSGFAPLQVNRLYRAFALHGLTNIYPGDSIVFGLSDSCTPDRVWLLSRMQHWYSAVWRDSVIDTEKRPLVIAELRCIVNGVLETSLLDAMQQTGLGPYLACTLADIFAWDINFFLDPRKGDTFQILFTRRYAENRMVGYGDILAARYTCNGKDFFAIGFPDSGGTTQYYDRSGRSVQKEFLKAPLRFSRISSGFTYHRRHPILGRVRPHLGIDYAAPTGTPVYAAADGKVTSAGWNGNYGKMVSISHGGSYATYYGHLSSIAPGIRTGAYVKQGRVIGTVGATGLATGPHLDYRMKRNGMAVNPRTVSLPSRSGIGTTEQEEFERLSRSYLALFSHRCAQKTGCFVLDVDRGGCGETVTSQVSSTQPVSRNVAKSGS